MWSRGSRETRFVGRYLQRGRSIDRQTDRHGKRRGPGVFLSVGKQLDGEKGRNRHILYTWAPDVLRKKVESICRAASTKGSESAAFAKITNPSYLCQLTTKEGEEGS